MAACSSMSSEAELLTQRRFFSVGISNFASIATLKLRKVLYNLTLCNWKILQSSETHMCSAPVHHVSSNKKNGGESKRKLIPLSSKSFFLNS